MSGENGKPAETPRVGDALVAALGFEPTDGDDAADGLGDEATVSVFVASDMATNSPPKGRLFGSEQDAAPEPRVSPSALGEGSSPTVVIGPEGVNVDETIDISAEEAAEMAEALKAGTDTEANGTSVAETDGVGHTILPDADTPDAEGGTVGANGSVHGDGVVATSGPNGANDVAAAGFPRGVIDPTMDLAQPSNANGVTGADVTQVAAASPQVGAEVPTQVPVAESVPTIMPTQAGVANPIGVDAGAVVGAGVGAEVSARQGLRDQSVGDRLSSATSRLPDLLDGSLLKRTRRVRARKVRRVVRHVDPWSVLTFSVLFHLCVFAALLLASVLVWNAAVAAGTIENIEDFIRDLGDYKTFEINGDVVFRAAMVIAGILTLASSLLLVLLTVVFNLISDLVGGIRVTVVEEETVRVRRRANQ